MDAAWLKRRLTELLGDCNDSGQQMAFCCPFCVERGERRPDTRFRLRVNPFKRESHGDKSQHGWFTCYNCQAKGSVETLLKKLGATVESQRVGWDELLATVDKIGEVETRPVDPASKELASFPCPTYQILPGMESYDYLHEKRGLSDELIAAEGLVVGGGRYAHRVFFPNWNEDGQMDFWSARSFDPAEQGPKYVHVQMPRKHRLYRYARVLRAIRRGELSSVVVTEGPISCLRAGSDAVASYGKYVAPEQVEMLVKMQHASTQRIRYLVALDGDALTYSFTLARSLHKRGLETYVVMLPKDHDPASLPPAEWQALRECAVRYEGPLSEVVPGLDHHVLTS